MYYAYDMNIPKDLVAASATPIVLAILKRGESYGYAIIQTVREVSDGRLTWSDGMLYPLLHRLEDADLIRSHWRKADTGRRRKYYRITPDGEEELQRLVEQWTVVHSALKRFTQSENEGDDDV